MAMILLPAAVATTAFLAAKMTISCSVKMATTTLRAT
jgi:hypothetical protein